MSDIDGDKTLAEFEEFKKRPRKKSKISKKAVLDAPPRIQTLSLRDFRGFPGPSKVDLHFGGKNMLIYGENGSGKSSIFHALDLIFDANMVGIKERAARLQAEQNIFSTGEDEDVLVEIDFGHPTGKAAWTQSGHPRDLEDQLGTLFAKPETDAKLAINAGALKKATLDYRSILKTNFATDNGIANLFRICIETLLRDYPALLPNGSPSTLGHLWIQFQANLRAAKNRKILATSEAKTILDNLNELVRSLNNGIAEACEKLPPLVAPILEALGWGDVHLTDLDFTQVRLFSKGSRANWEIIDGVIHPKVSFLEQPLSNPGTFLNEARLSALGLALFLAGRELCANSTIVSTPYLMVLDDVLIGLDQANRHPVLKLLQEKYALGPSDRFDAENNPSKRWQVVILTHDYVWYQMARSVLNHAEKDWSFAEIRGEINAEGFPMAVVTGNSSLGPAAEHLKKAEAHLKEHDHHAAAVHTRISMEIVLKKFCDKNAIAVRFKEKQRELTVDDLVSGIESWLSTEKGKVKGKDLPSPLAKMKTWRSVVLNPFSHAAPSNITNQEVKSAFEAVSELKDALTKL